MADKTDLTRTRRPAEERECAFQERSLFSIFDMRGSQSVLRSLVGLRGMPRYEMGNCAIVQLSNLEYVGPRWSEFPNMMMELLLKLIDKPDISSKEYKATLRHRVWLTLGYANRIVSSAKCRLYMVRVELGSLMPSKRLLDIANLIIRLKMSATRTKSRGDSGSP